MTHVLDMFTSMPRVHLFILWVEETKSVAVRFSFIFLHLQLNFLGSLIAAVICMQLTSIPAKIICNITAVICLKLFSRPSKLFCQEKWFLVL